MAIPNRRSLITRLGVVIVLSLVHAAPVSAAESEADEKKVELFDGKTFTGWEGDTEKTWRIEDGALTAGSMDEPAPRNDFLATTRSFENFELRVKFKIVGERLNAGVQFRTKRIEGTPDVSGYQADIAPQYDGHIYDEGRRRKLIAKPTKSALAEAQAAVGADGWQTYRIRAEGPRLRLWLNGVQTVDYTEQDADIPTTGIIALQVHKGMQGKVWYKDISIVELPAGE